jgi:hypothetical protein
MAYHNDSRLVHGCQKFMATRMLTCEYCELWSSLLHAMGDSSWRLHFDQGKKNEIQHHSYRKSVLESSKDWWLNVVK